jgi:hypothetical protein
MTTTMTSRQLEFWRNLLRPFPPQHYSTIPGRKGKDGTPLVYLDARVIRIRLMDELGLSGWRQEFRPIENGLICRLSILAPDRSDAGWEWCAQEDGGGVENMGRNDRQSGEWIEDDDNSSKAAFTNSFRRAAAAFGFGIELYKVGVPEWMSDLFPGQTHTYRTPEPPRRDGNGSGQGNGHDHGGNGNRPPAPTGGGNMNPPGANRAGSKAGYAWAMKAGEHFGISVLDRMNSIATRLGYPTRTDQWDGDQLEDVVRHTVAWLRTLDHYSGEFEAWAEAHGGPYGLPDPEELVSASEGSRGRPQEARGEAQGRPEPDRPAQPDGGRLASQRRAIAAAAEALVVKQAGRKPTREELVATISEAASCVKDGGGVTGQVMDSLGKCEDATWLRNIVAFLNEQISRAAQEAVADAPDSDIPF